MRGDPELRDADEEANAVYIRDIAAVLHARGDAISSPTRPTTHSSGRWPRLPRKPTSLRWQTNCTRSLPRPIRQRVCSTVWPTAPGSGSDSTRPALSFGSGQVVPAPCGQRPPQESSTSSRSSASNPLAPARRIGASTSTPIGPRAKLASTAQIAAATGAELHAGEPATETLSSAPGLANPCSTPPSCRKMLTLSWPSKTSRSDAADSTGRAQPRRCGRMTWWSSSFTPPSSADSCTEGSDAKHPGNCLVSLGASI